MLNLCFTRTLGTDPRFAAVRSLRKHLGDTNMQANGEKDKCNFELSPKKMPMEKAPAMLHNANREAGGE